MKKLRRVVENIPAIYPEVRQKVNDLLDQLCNEQPERLNAMAEEQCVVASSILFMKEDMGIASKYYFSLPWGTVTAWDTDEEDPEDVIEPKIERFRLTQTPVTI